MSYGPQETHKAIYQVLSQDSALTTLLGGANRVLDVAKPEQLCPFITIGDIQWEDRGNHSWEGLGAVITVNTWVQEPSRKRVQEIQKRIDEILHNSEPIITGWNIVGLRRGTTNIIVDPDNITLHGIQTFNLMIGS